MKIQILSIISKKFYILNNNKSISLQQLMRCLMFGLVQQIKINNVKSNNITNDCRLCIKICSDD